MLAVALRHQVTGGEFMPDVDLTMKRVSASPEEEIVKLEKGLNEAITRADVKTLDAGLADEWTAVGDDGTTITKASLLADVKSGKLVVTKATMDEIKVNSYGEAAVVTSRNYVKQSYAGTDTSEHYRLTDTPVRKDGQWRLVLSHSSRITKE
jgi:hypothetical protein